MFTFTKDCVIGIEAIDNDHKRMFELLNDAMKLAQNAFVGDKYDQIKEILEELDEYATNNFTREEEYMLKICDPELIMQRVQHKHFQQKVWGLLYKNIDENDEQDEVLDEILTFLTHWLYQHIITSDAMIGKLEPFEEWMVRENPCEFRDEYEIGNILIDAEHRTLFEITGKVYDILKDGATIADAPDIVSILDELKKYTIEHFADEEEYMQSINYAGLEAQKKAHQSFVYALNDIDKEKIYSDPADYVGSLLEFLLGWLINHILKVDTLIPSK